MTSKTISSRDFIKAIEDGYPDHHRKAAMGDVFVIYKLARLYDCGRYFQIENPWDERFIVGCEHYQKALELYKHGVAKDDPECWYGLAIMYQTGRWSPDFIPNASGHLKEHDLYTECLKKAAALGLERATKRLASEVHD